MLSAITSRGKEFRTLTMLRAIFFRWKTSPQSGYWQGSVWSVGPYFYGDRQLADTEAQSALSKSF